MSELAIGKILEALVPLVSASQEEELNALSVSIPDAVELLDEVERRGWINSFQRRLLAQGRGAELRLGTYILLEPLGEGGMGTVYRARHALMRRLVAVKVLLPEFTRDKEATRRFHREVELAGAMTHPHVVHAYDAGEVDGRHFLAMELVEGADLMALVQVQGALPLGKACDLIGQAALGLQYAHERGLVHRDIKPSNLLVTTRQGPDGLPPGRVKILDLGLARLTIHADGEAENRFKTRAGSFLGTPDFLAPEQALDPSKADIRSDIYALGCTLFFVLMRKPPFPEDGTITQKLLWHQQHPAPSIDKLRADIPADFATFLSKMLAKDPARRPQTPMEVAEALAVWATPETPADSPITSRANTALSAGATWSILPGAETANVPSPPPPAAHDEDEPAALPTERLSSDRYPAWIWIVLSALTIILIGSVYWVIDQRNVKKGDMTDWIDKEGSEKDKARLAELEKIKDVATGISAAALAKKHAIVLVTEGGSLVPIDKCYVERDALEKGKAHDIGPFLYMTDLAKNSGRVKEDLDVRMIVPFELLDKVRIDRPSALSPPGASYLLLKGARFGPDEPYFPGGRIATYCEKATEKPELIDCLKELCPFRVLYAPLAKKPKANGNYLLEVRVGKHEKDKKTKLDKTPVFSTILRTGHFSPSVWPTFETVRSASGDMTAPAQWRLDCHGDGIYWVTAKGTNESHLEAGQAFVAGATPAGFLMMLALPADWQGRVQMRKLTEGEEKTYFPVVCTEVTRAKMGGDHLKVWSSDPLFPAGDIVYRFKGDREWRLWTESPEISGERTIELQFRGVDGSRVERTLTGSEKAKGS